ncbi:unnamed protein product [Blepharisma stoltei]|uniref:Ion transport domain-containing protein n=1 Tax=Blepharisma stoltei TaxID=1481888 RepID=A0AAU9K6H0_9CILI|nr:unnamed protein product [Blepharisma stoltei]
MTDENSSEKPIFETVQEDKNNNDQTALSSLTSNTQSNLIKLNPIMLEITQNTSVGIAKDFQATLHYISARLPKFIRIPFKGTCMKPMRGGETFVCGANKRLIICNEKEILKDWRIDAKIQSIDITDDDKFAYIATENLIKKISLYDFETVTTFKGHEDLITVVCVSWDEKFLYSAGKDCTVRVSIDDGINFSSQILYKHENIVLALNISKDGLHLLSGDAGKTIILYSITNKTVQSRLESPEGNITCVKFSPKKTYFATSDQHFNINIWKFETCKIVKVLKGHENEVSTMKFNSSDSILVTGSKDNSVRVWSIHTNQDEVVLLGHEKSVRAISISYNEKIIFSFGRDYKISMWKFPKFQNNKLLFGHNDTIYKLLISQKRKYIYSNSDDCKIIVWDFVTNKIIHELIHDSSMYAMAMSLDEDMLFSCTDDQKIVIWDLETYEKIKEIILEETSVRAILITPDNRFVITGDEAFRISIWEMENLTLKHVIRSHRNAIWSLALHGDHLFSGDQNGEIMLHDLKEFKLHAELKGNSTKVQTIKATKDGELLISGYRDGEIKIWSIKNRNCLRTIKFHTDVLREIYCSTDGKYFFACSEDQRLTVFDLKNFGFITGIKTKNKIRAMEFTDGEHEIVCALENVIQIIQNPLKASWFNPKKPHDITIFGPSFGKYKFMKYISDIMLSETPPHNPEMDQFIIEPYHLNALHFYAYFNLPSHLKKSIKLGDGFFPSIRNETPLSICLKKSYTECTAAIFSAMKDISTANPYSFYYFEDSIVDLNFKGFPGLEHLYKSIFIRCKDLSLPKFCNEKSKLPYIVHSSYIIPKKENFSTGVRFTSEGKDIMYLQSLVRLDIEIGTKESLRFLESLDKCPNTQILKTRLIRTILNEKWEKIGWVMYVQAAIFATYLILLSIYAVKWEFDENHIIPAFVFHLILTSYELFQLYVGGIYYLKDLYNWVDWGRITLFTIHIILLWSHTYQDWNEYILGALISISYYRSTIFFNIYSKTRLLNNLLLAVFYDLIAFFIILLFSTFAFAITLCAVKGDTSISFFTWITLAWRANIGDYDNNADYYDPMLMWAFHWIFTVINPIILINLLISLMGDTFQRVKENWEIADAKEMIYMMLEVETLLFWKRNKGKKEFLQTCSSVENLEEKEEIVNKKLINLDKEIGIMLEKFKGSHEERLKILRENLDAAKAFKESLNKSKKYKKKQ